MSDDHMKAPCKHCPFRSDVRPFLHPGRAEEIAYSAGNPYSEFHCHKTTEPDDRCDGEMVATASSKICAGFLAMQINEAGIDCPEGFEIPENVYADSYEMTEAYQIEWDKNHKRKRG